jgi:hypothetical protein
VLDNQDVRSHFRNVGISDDTGAHLSFKFSRDVHNMNEYVSRGLFGPHTEHFVISCVPVETAEYFFKQFTPAEFMQLRGSINTECVTDSLLSAPHDYRYVTFIAKLLRMRVFALESAEMPKSMRFLYKELPWGTKLLETARVLYMESHKDPARVDMVLELMQTENGPAAFSLPTALWLLRMKNSFLERISDLFERYGEDVRVGDIILFASTGLSPEPIIKIFLDLPEEMRMSAVAIALVTTHSDVTTQDIRSLGEYLVAGDCSDEFTPAVLWGYMRDSTTVRDVLRQMKQKRVASIQTLLEIPGDTRLTQGEWLAFANAIGSEATLHCR